MIHPHHLGSVCQKTVNNKPPIAKKNVAQKINKKTLGQLASSAISAQQRLISSLSPPGAQPLLHLFLKIIFILISDELLFAT